MNQLILQGDETCPLQNCRTKLDFPAYEHLALTQGYRQVGFVGPVEELREIRPSRTNMAPFLPHSQVRKMFSSVMQGVSTEGQNSSFGILTELEDHSITVYKYIRKHLRI